MARDGRNLLVLAALATAVRLASLLSSAPVLATDSSSYLDLAHRLGSGHLAGSPGARTPGYPALLMLAGDSPRAIWWVQSVIGVAGVLLLYRLARRLGATPALALAGAAFLAVDLEGLALERFVLTETVATFLILLAATVATEVVFEGAARTRVALGVVLGALCLVRPDTAALAAYLGLALAVVVARRRGAGARGALAGVALVLLVPVVVLVAWAGVNRATIGVFTVSTVLGHNMIDHVAADVRVEPGLNHGIEAAYVAARARRLRQTSDLANLSGDAAPAMERAAHLDAAHLSSRLLQIALGVIARHPLSYVSSSVRQWPHFFIPPNYPTTFGSGLLDTVWKVQRAVTILVELGFLLWCALALMPGLRRPRTRYVVRRRSGRGAGAAGGPGAVPGAGPDAVLAGLVPVGLLVATFLAYGETGRYGVVYFPIMLAIVCAAVPRRARRSRTP